MEKAIQFMLACFLSLNAYEFRHRNKNLKRECIVTDMNNGIIPLVNTASNPCYDEKYILERITGLQMIKLQPSSMVA